ncbi:MAG TPA: Lrp/AsnC family transcriptional regulator [Rhizomicrobium sp.]|jgi:Lrp/AsnC family leucine-responsive transcriptional regulator|nr:Lrp/AsnC family transcriptional regulator [Rhizomicrobium sp.]
MDRIDRKILALYQNDTRRIAQSIGAEVGLSAAAVQRRLKRLRRTGAIAAEVALLDGKALGVPITCVVTLSAAGAPSQLDRFKRQMRGQPQVQQCYHVTGSTDFILVVTATSMEAYGEFARTWFEAGQNVARYETHVVLDRVKVGLSLPVADGAASLPSRAKAARAPAGSRA